MHISVTALKPLCGSQGPRILDPHQELTERHHNHRDCITVLEHFSSAWFWETRETVSVRRPAELHFCCPALRRNVTGLVKIASRKTCSALAAVGCIYISGTGKPPPTEDQSCRQHVDANRAGTGGVTSATKSGILSLTNRQRRRPPFFPMSILWAWKQHSTND